MHASHGQARSCYMQQRFTAPQAALIYHCNRFPWNVSRGIGRYVFGKVDHRDATVMAQAEPPVRAVCCVVLDLKQSISRSEDTW